MLQTRLTVYQPRFTVSWLPRLNVVRPRFKASWPRLAAARGHCAKAKMYRIDGILLLLMQKDAVRIQVQMQVFKTHASCPKLQETTTLIAVQMQLCNCSAYDCLSGLAAYSGC